MRILLASADSARTPTFGYRYKTAFERAGHEVVPFNYRFLHLHRFAAGRAFINRKLVTTAARTRPDLLFVVKGETFSANAIDAVKTLGVHTAGYTMDDPFDLGSNKIPALRSFDSFFCFDSSYLPALKKINPRSYWLPCAVDPALHQEVIPQPRNEPHSIGFAGSHYPNRQIFLNKLADLPLAVSGYRWQEKTQNTPLAKAVQPAIHHADKKLADLREVCKTFNQTKINLNIHFTHSKRSPNLRTFEIPATNSFELCDYLADLHTMFSIGKELVVYKNVADCRKKIQYYLDNTQERRKIAKAGQKRVLKDHTFDNRVRDVLRAIKNEL
ncbi:glycosyltransferase [Candidatus Woesearchaeota archaeon]|nr:glycosyltransferase [Candidatus Woesearchaeota archaeon]